MTLHESIDNLFKNINSISLKEATLSRDIFKYSGRSKQELQSLVHGAETCVRSFEAKYSFETRDTISETKKLTYYDDYHGCITYLALLLAMYGGHSYNTYLAIIFPFPFALNDGGKLYTSLLILGKERILSMYGFSSNPSEIIRIFFFL